MNYLFIADFFVHQIPNGGAEIANSVVIDGLRRAGHNVSEILSGEVHEGIIEEFYGRIIVANFIQLDSASIEAIQKKDYIIYEHDFKMLRARCPLRYNGMIAPKSEVINVDFYSNARKVVLQSKKHLEIVKKNLDIDNLVSATCNPWRESDLDLLEILSENDKTRSAAVVVYGIQQKNTVGALNYCLQNSIDCGLIHKRPHKQFLLELSKYKTLVFFPEVFKTFSRVTFEARCLGLEILANENISFLHEECSRLKGRDLINFARENTKKVIDLFVE